MALVNVSVVIPTRGDVDMKPILRALPDEWEVIVYDNGRGSVFKKMPSTAILARIITGKGELPDLVVYARYAAIEYAENDLIFTQDDDCVVSDPQAIVEAWDASYRQNPDRIAATAHVVCNMPANFRARHFYDHHSLVGFGACFHRDAPQRAFDRFTFSHPWHSTEGEHFRRTCDMVFTYLTPRVLVDVEYVDMPWASAENRMWKQPWHQEVRNETLAQLQQMDPK